MKLTKATKVSDIKRTWHFIDAKAKILGRTATDIAKLLIGKDKPYFVPNLDCGDFVVIVNARQVSVTGKKAAQKIYMNYSGYPGGLKRKTYEVVMKENPTRIIYEAVSGMLPKNKLRASMLKRLYIYPDEKHPYENKLKAQNSNVKSIS